MLILEDTEVRWCMRGISENRWLYCSTFWFQVLLRWKTLTDHLLCLFLLVPLKHPSLKVSPGIGCANLVFELILEEVFVY